MRSDGGATGDPPTYRQAVDLYRAGRLRDTLNACLARLAIAPPDAPTVTLLARVLLDSGHVVDAAREFTRSLALDGRNPDAWLGLAQAQLMTGDRESSLASVDKALAISPLGAEVHAVSAGLLLRAGDPVAAATLARRAIGLAPGLVSGWFTLALALQDEGRAADALLWPRVGHGHWPRTTVRRQAFARNSRRKPATSMPPARRSLPRSTGIRAAPRCGP